MSEDAAQEDLVHRVHIGVNQKDRVQEDTDVTGILHCRPAWKVFKR